MSLPGLRVFQKPYTQHKSVLLHLFLGGSTTAICIGTFILFDNYLDMDVLVANLLFRVCSVSFAYVTNRVWVFLPRNRQSPGKRNSFLCGQQIGYSVI
ncbi:MAG: GtrA family protein [Oscillospiraceae bacterium]|nr:GtrA family protein [Oscillospiraceae bacterium]